MVKGRPVKRKRTTTGLRNQQSSPVVTSESSNGDDDGIDDEEIETEELWEDKWFDSEELEQTMFLHAAAMNEDIANEDWVLESLLKAQERKKKQRREREHKEHPKVYATGPDIARKASRTQFRSKAAMRTQMMLHSFGIVGDAPVNHGQLASHQSICAPVSVCIESVEPDPEEQTRSLSPPVKVRIESIEPDLPAPNMAEGLTRSLSPPVRIRIESIEPDLYGLSLASSAPAQAKASDPPSNSPKKSLEDWEDELKDMAGQSGDILGWAEVNQLLIIQNFVTLQLKGSSQMGASEEIALQWHEGEGKYFARRKVGDVTPHSFMQALNAEIFPGLNIHRPKPLCTRTAQRWLNRLGWCLTVLWKGVYMDGHERPDVIEYRNKIFLLMMAKYECRMAHYEGPDLYQPGWGPANQSCRRKVEVASFMYLTLLMKQMDALSVEMLKRTLQKMQAQLLEQVKGSIKIFKEAHPDCQALFIFDQSSAHASLGPNALKSFEMNKGNGGKQRKQHHTVIPQSNLVPEHRGKVQKMTLPDGTAKGLQQVLEERRFDVKKMKAKCSPYWGWSKYRYRQVPKPTFRAACYE
ncbi:hypothetical protein DFH05DRAFT_1460850 [Lentinula detonsa]|uniref:Uncharacterized protein n=1 Tax=Lentinula detonsa TaxID=2804962 RepID=A0A9W8NYW5_9AGAR|nr:hypothetical protein DFH05DRAFT_1460850 [Lentinula detonsa]